MCDTLVATGDVTADGVVLFGKNSDREPNEAQYLDLVPACDHPSGSRVRCTYIDIPQVAHTYGVLLSRPFWIWGAEMGANEHGVAIGNEAVFTKVPQRKTPSLIGMDLLRLALERAASAPEALQVITELLGAYGQAGNCGFQHKSYYHNSFLIADPRQAWVLETAGPFWAAKRVHGVYTISNGITLGADWDLASPGLVEHAVERGWCGGREDFHFARCYSDLLYTSFSDSRRRRSRTTELLGAQVGQIMPSTLMAVLRDHGEDAYRPDRGMAGAQVCMHASFGPIRFSQTAGSLVSHLREGAPTHFATGTAAPCTGLFKPLWLDAGLPALGAAPDGTFDAATLYWQHELLHRAVLRDHGTLAALYADERDELEQRSIATALMHADAPSETRQGLSAQAFSGGEAAEAQWLARVAGTPTTRRRRVLHARYWHTMDRQAGMADPS